MVAFTYIAKRSGDQWKASRISSEEGAELSAEAADTYELQKELKKISVENSDGGSVATLLSTINKNTLVFQVTGSLAHEIDKYEAYPGARSSWDLRAILEGRSLRAGASDDPIFTVCLSY